MSINEQEWLSDLISFQSQCWAGMTRTLQSLPNVMEYRSSIPRRSNDFSKTSILWDVTSRWWLNASCNFEGTCRIHLEVITVHGPSSRRDPLLRQRHIPKDLNPCEDLKMCPPNQHAICGHFAQEQRRRGVKLTWPCHWLRMRGAIPSFLHKALWCGVNWKRTPILEQRPFAELCMQSCYSQLPVERHKTLFFAISKSTITVATCAGQAIKTVAQQNHLGWIPNSCHHAVPVLESLTLRRRHYAPPKQHPWTLHSSRINWFI